MCRVVPFALALAVCTAAFAQGSANYQITINGQTSDVALDGEYTFTTPGGEKITYVIKKKDIVTFEDEMVSFQHSGALTVSTTKIDEGIEQVLAVTPLGTGYIIQEYDGMDPSTLNDLMLQELTKEDVSYGYELSKEEYAKVLKSGQTLKGIKATLKYKDEEKYYTITSHGARDKGVLVITMIDKEYQEKESPVIDLLWESLALK